MSDSFHQDDEDDQPGFFKKYRMVIIIGVLAAIGAGAWALAPKDKPRKKSSSVSMVNIMPPPPPTPPPPTPPPTPPPVEEPREIPENQPEFVEETQPESAPQPESPPEEAAPMGSNIQGEGDNFGLSGKGGGGMIGGLGSGNRQGGNSKYGFYAGQVQSRVAAALRSNKKTRSATLDLKVRIWVDSNGRIQRAKLEGSSGNAAVDRALAEEALAGLQLSEPPPQDMPMPIVMRISAKRPN
jgi:TonB family protein